MAEKEKKKTPIAGNLVDNTKFLQERIGVGTSFDLGVRKIRVLNREVHIYYCNGLCDTQYIIELLKQIVRVNDDERQESQAWKIIENRLVHQQVSPVMSLDEAVDKLLSGLIIVLVEGESTGFAVDVRSYPGRQPQEPDTEKVVRGARDGYVENIIVNTALTRRRIRDERLRFEMLQVGERSKTDVCIAYIQDVADPGLVELVKKELQQIRVDGLTMGDKTVEEFLVKQGYNPYPLVRYTERPDVAATHLLEGHVLIMVDTSPSVIITPTTFFHHVQHAEEYRQSPGVGTFVRWVRFLGILSSLFLLPLWVLFVLDPSLLPEPWAFIGPNKQTNIPIVVQILLADFGIEFLRMAAIHTPTPLSTAMGLIAAVLIGQIAIDVGLFVPEVILYVAVAAIGSFATPSYELSVANKISRLALVILVALFHVPGLVIGTTVYLLWLVSIRSLNTPYLWPFIPFDPAAFMQIIVRRSAAGAKVRPSIVHPQDRQKQPT
ncbi:spore germination protein [Geobacillus sp. C56-T2]|uniref:spore germination protein n=1 Tax=Geobacillus sp. C56-T2 TaxID=600773 RepID=UPI0011A4FD54|nr:spore germination protein [Geobacillus sp. C56-T2]NNV05681.1 spore germination protein [Geobacillus sp. MMMUD3]TWG31066.1 stage V sporulation protein AF [Geobacillus sp. C56-T2]